MQKARQNNRVKWMLQDLIHEINGCSSVGYQRPLVRAEHTHWNRDRPGGHKHLDLKIRSVENMFTDEVGTARRKSIKKVNRKLQRNNHKKVVAEALADYEWCNEFYLYPYGTDLIEYDSLQEHFIDEERERQRQLLYQYDNDYYMEDFIDDMDADDQLYDDILDDRETWHQQEDAWHQRKIGYYRDEY